MKKYSSLDIYLTDILEIIHFLKSKFTAIEKLIQSILPLGATQYKYVADPGR